MVGAEFERVGASPVLLEWGGRLVSQMDASALVARRRGARLQDLFVNDAGLHVYFRGLPYLWFAGVERVADGRSLLCVFEEE